MVGQGAHGVHIATSERRVAPARASRDSVSGMSRGLVLVIEDDEWVSRLLESAIREAGYDVVVCATAKTGLEAAFDQKPDCIVCDIDLPDTDGYSVARHVRTHPSRVSVTPFLFLSGFDDEQSRIEGFHVGADVYITKPFRVDEVVAQIEALVQMATRLRARRDSMLSLPPGAPLATAIEGDLGQMSIATVLTVLEMERRTGTFEVVSKKRRAHLDIVSGNVMEGTVGGTKVSALAALRTMLGWNVGRFSFVPSATRELPAMHGSKSLGAFLIEALRLEDEATRAELELPPSRRRPNDAKIEPKMAAPALGGPASSPADFAPPSTRLPRPTELSLLLDPELADWEIPADVAPTEAPARTAHQAIPPPAIEQTPPAGPTETLAPPPDVPKPPVTMAAGPPPPKPRVPPPRPPPRPPPPQPTPREDKKRV
jgi:DNA-binding response OmpR family regulator